jgi:hypothetical protein
MPAPTTRGVTPMSHARMGRAIRTRRDTVGPGSNSSSPTRSGRGDPVPVTAGRVGWWHAPAPPSASRSSMTVVCGVARLPPSNGHGGGNRHARGFHGRGVARLFAYRLTRWPLALRPRHQVAGHQPRPLRVGVTGAIASCVPGLPRRVGADHYARVFALPRLAGFSGSGSRCMPRVSGVPLSGFAMK